MIPYFGGKSSISRWINEFVPRKIDTYVEPFSGAYWVYINGKFTVKKAIYNDMNKHMVNVFTCIKDYKTLYKKLNSKKYLNMDDKNIYAKYRLEIFEKEFLNKISIPDMDVAAKFLYVLTQVFSGTNPEKATWSSGDPKKLNAFLNKLVNTDITNRIDKISNMHNWDFEKVINKYDGDDTFFYCDPPYYGYESDRKDGYALNNFSITDHERLSNILKNIKGKFAISYYDFDELKKLYPKSKYNWESNNFKRAACAIKGKKQTETKEILIMNYKTKSIKDFFWE